MADWPVERCFLARVYAAADRFPDRIALQLPGPEGMISITYRQLLVEVERGASQLAELDVGPGDRVVLFMENHPLWCARFLSILQRRAVAVPLDVHYGERDLHALIADCGAAVAFASATLAAELEQVRRALPALRRVVPIELEAWRPPAAAEVATPDWGEPDDLVSLMYTSGTTGDPKGVMLTNGTVMAQLDGLVGAVPVDESDTILSLLPLSHVLAQLANLLFPLVVGARTVFVDELTTGAIARALHEGQVTVFGGVPQLFYLFHQRIMGEVDKRGRLARWMFRRLGRLNGWLRGFGINLGRGLFGRVHQAFGGRIKLFYCGASYLDPEVAWDFHRWGFHFLQGYGMTETCGAATFTRLSDNRIGTVGQPLEGVEIRLDQPNAEGIGEVLIRGPIVMRGYYNKPERTAEVLRDGWLHSGDLGRLDRQGHLTLTGRAKDVIVLANGKNIYPEELERHYGQIPYFKEICVVGVQSSAGRSGEEMLHAVIVPDFERLKADGIASAAEAIRFELENASAQLPHYKRVLSFELRADPLPRTTTRKIKRHQVVQALTFGTGAAAAAPVAEPTAAERELLESREGRLIAQAVRAAGRDRPLRAATHLELDLGFDSLTRVELLAGVEEQLGVRLDEQTSSSIATVGELVEALRAAAPALPGQAKRRGGSWPEILAAARGDADLADYFRTGPINAALHFVVLKLLLIVSRALFRLEVSGLQHLPRARPFLICPNHQSYVDGFLVSSALPLRITRHLFYLGEAVYFGEGFGRWFARQARIVPVNPDTNLLQAMRVAGAALHLGKILTIYPEGERSIDGTLKRFKKGAAILARELQAPVVPVAIAGAYRVWARASGRIRLEKVRIRFGPPIDPAPFVAINDPEAAYAALTDKLRARVAELLTELDPAAVRDAA